MRVTVSNFMGRFALLVVSVLSLLPVPTSGQPIVWDNFDDYDPWTSIVGQGDWEAWDLVGTDALVSEEIAFSEPNSLRLQPSSDVVQVITDAREGQWTARAMTLVPSDMEGDAYLILLNTYSHGGAKNWSTQVVFNRMTVASAGGSDFGRNASLRSITDRWVEIRVEIDLDNNEQVIYYDGEVLDLAHPWQASGINEIQCIDIFSDTADGFFYDDIVLDERCVIDALAEPSTGTVPLEVTFQAGDAECPGADLVEYSWDFGDGGQARGTRVTHTYTEPGVYRVSMTAFSDDDVPYPASAVVIAQCVQEEMAPWSEENVGDPAYRGCARRLDGCIEFHGGGEGITGPRDELHFLYQRVTGDFSAVARIREAEWATNAAAGIMARVSLDPDSAFAFSSARRLEDRIVPALFRRRSAGSSASPRSLSTPVGPPDLYLRLDRSGDDFTSFVSTNGQEWTEVRTLPLDKPPADLLVGLAASPADQHLTARITFCDISISAIGTSIFFRRGDADGDGSVALTDAVRVLNFLFLGGPEPPCREAADTDDNGDLAITDAIGVLNYLFLGGTPPPAPGPEDCGTDPEGSPAAGCASYESCDAQ